MKRILVTGGLGFIGSALIRHLITHTEHKVLNIDKETYAAMPAPKLVVAMGDCAGHGGEFGISYASCGPVANVLPVDAVIPGCPPSPLDLLHGILDLLQG